MYSLILTALVAPAAAVLSYGSSVVDTASRGPVIRSDAAIKKALSKASLGERDTTFKNSTSVSKSFDNATLFDMTVNFNDPASSGIEISLVCSTCYLAVEASAELVVQGSQNISEAIDTFVGDVAQDIVNMTETIADEVVDAFANLTTQFFEGHLGDLQWPTIDVDLDLDVGGLDDVQLVFSLDVLDLYVDMQASLAGAASFELNLFTSETALGIRVSDELELGLVLTVDLLASADGALTGGSGFHLRMDDGLVITLDLFGNLTDIVFNGGTVELLPLTVDAEASFSAVLRATLHTGVAVSDKVLDIDTDALAMSAGVEAIVFANLLNVTTSIAASNHGATGDDVGSDMENCTLAAAEAVEFAMGAGVGASIAIDAHSWGIGPTGIWPVWTSAWSQCVTKTTAATPTTTALARRDSSDLVTSTISTTFTYSAVGCKSTGLANCPASLQTTAMTTSKSTTTAVVSSGEDATWPAATASTVQTSAFGTNARGMKLSATDGETATDTSSSGPVITSDSALTVLVHGLTTKQKNIIIGVCVGVGVPLLVLAVVYSVFCVRCRRNQNLPQKMTGARSSDEQFIKVGRA